MPLLHFSVCAPHPALPPSFSACDLPPLLACVQVNALFFGALTFVTPLRFALPIQLTSLLATLVFSAQRCRLECGAPASSLVWPLSAAAWPQSCPATDGYGAAAAAAAEAAAGLSCLAPADPQAAERYYGAAASWFSRALPLTFDWNAWSGSSDWQPGKACLPLCFSVHAWLQVRAAAYAACLRCTPGAACTARPPAVPWSCSAGPVVLHPALS